MIRELGCGKCGTDRPRFRLFIDSDVSDRQNIRDMINLKNEVGNYYNLTIECAKCGAKNEIHLGSD